MFFGISLLVGLVAGWFLMKAERWGFAVGGAVLGWVVATFVQSALLSAINLPNPEVFYYLLVAVLAIVGAIACGVSIVCAVIHSHWNRVDVPDVRHQLPKKLMDMLGRDMAKGSAINLGIDFSSPTQKRKKTRTPSRAFSMRASEGRIHASSP